MTGMIEGQYCLDGVRKVWHLFFLVAWCKEGFLKTIK